MIKSPSDGFLVLLYVKHWLNGRGAWQKWANNMEAATSMQMLLDDGAKKFWTVCGYSGSETLAISNITRSLTDRQPRSHRSRDPSTDGSNGQIGQTTK